MAAADKARTLTVTTSSAQYTMPTDGGQGYDWLKMTNLDTTNNVWVQLDSATASASQRGDGCEVILPGRSILVPAAPDNKYYMIAITASVYVNVVKALGRI